MTSWKTYSLGEICDLVAGFAFKSKDFGAYPNNVVKTADIQPPIVNTNELAGVDISQYDTIKLRKYIVTKGDYVFAMTGATIGKLGRITNEIEAYINQRVLTFRPDESIIDKN
jgi:type I restriction enzyme S subunit